MNLRTVNVTRYVTPLREGGSLPAIVEADDDGLYVLKFRAGQGVRALTAELVAGEIARALGLRVPEIVFVELDPRLAMTEPDPEIQDLIKASAGVNLALDYLPGSIMYDTVIQPPGSRLASEIVWFDAYTANVDRTARNANMLLWHKEIWLIDHGAALYFHHDWGAFPTKSRNPFVLISQHMLKSYASDLAAVDEEFSARLTQELLANVVAMIPDAWLTDSAAERDVYLQFLIERLDAPRDFVQEALK